MPKKLKAANVNRADCLTVRELHGFLAGFNGDPTTNMTPILLRCNGRNYRLAKFEAVAGKPVLVGKRRQSD